MLSRSCYFTLATLFLLGHGLALILPAAPADAQCDVVEIGVPVDSANNIGSVFLGEALGQTFVADRLLIRSITVWRTWPFSTSIYGIHLYLNPTDSLGSPDVDHMLLDGPTLHVTGDGVHPTEFEFVFDPPIQLPKPGIYEFAVQSDPCGGLWDIHGVTNFDLYPMGKVWKHSRSINPGCPLRRFPESNPNGDLCFRVRFCDEVTPTKRSSWGEIKALYR